MKRATVTVIATLALLISGASETYADPLQGGQNLPSTSTYTGHTPLVVLGMVILATGVVLLRRPVIVPNR